MSDVKDCELKAKCPGWKTDSSSDENCFNFKRGCFADWIEAPRTADSSGSNELGCYNLSLEEAQDMLFTLQFALDVIENAELGNTTNKSNWTLDKSLEEQIELLQAKL